MPLLGELPPEISSQFPENFLDKEINEHIIHILPQSKHRYITPITWACSANKMDVVECLLLNGANPNHASKYEPQSSSTGQEESDAIAYTPLSIAIGANNIPLIKLLCIHDAKITPEIIEEKFYQFFRSSHNTFQTGNFLEQALLAMLTKISFTQFVDDYPIKGLEIHLKIINCIHMTNKNGKKKLDHSPYLESKSLAEGDWQLSLKFGKMNVSEFEAKEFITKLTANLKIIQDKYPETIKDFIAMEIDKLPNLVMVIDPHHLQPLSQELANYISLPKNRFSDLRISRY
ncbi:MAG: hypothetical protein JWM09_1341 [Francisellaceae bacterium]|nr:hypothetical protein [Francisellaceae bacterium]